MPRIETQKDLRAVLKLHFCYICGGPLGEAKGARTKDHVPPKKLFVQEDRNPPLQLPTHRKCNIEQNLKDELIGQLVGMLHGKMPSRRDNRMKLGMTWDPKAGRPVGLLLGPNLERIVWRWITGFHAALYQEHLPGGIYQKSLHLPLPHKEKASANWVPKKLDPMHSILVEEIKKNRVVDRLDTIRAFNGKCRYECVWALDDSQRHGLCVFALRIYNWEILGASDPPRGCVGIYQSPYGIPVNASRATSLEMPFSNVSYLDPFGP